MAPETTTKVDSAIPDLEVADSPMPPATSKKVDLDLDDAPFLQAEESPVPQEAFEPAVPNEEDEEALKKKRKKRLIIIAAAGILLLIILAAAGWFFFREPPAPPMEAPKPDVIVVPSTPAPPENTEIVRAFAPFIVPVMDAQGKTNFLICQFSAISNDPKVNQDINQQMMPLRDAIYFYLRGKDAQYLTNARNAEAIKKDLVSIFNDYLSQGKIEDIVLESYLHH